MNIPLIPRPYNGSLDDIVAEERQLTGRTRLRRGWFRERVEFEVNTIVTVDATCRFGPTDIRQHIQGTDWIKA